MPLLFQPCIVLGQDMSNGEWKTPELYEEQCKECTWRLEYAGNNRWDLSSDKHGFIARLTDLDRDWLVCRAASLIRQHCDATHGVAVLSVGATLAAIVTYALFLVAHWLRKYL